MHSKYGLKVNKLPKSEVEIEGEIEARLLDLAKVKALEKFNQSLDIAGFRKGKIPEKMVLEKVGEHRVLEESAEIAINSVLPEILQETGITPLGRPELNILKLAFGNPLVFKMKFAVLPEFKLPDYKNIVVSSKPLVVSEPEVTEKEVEDVLLQIRKNKAHYDWHAKHPELVEGQKGHHDHPDLDKEENLPKLDDEFAKSAGNFENLEELQEKVKQNIIEEKKNKEIEKRRATLIEELIKNTEIDVPEILIESEVEKSLAQMKDHVAQVGGKFEEYLEHMKKGEEDLKKDLRGESEKKAKIQLIFNKIAEIEKLEPNKEMLEHEVKKILEMYPGASETNARIFVATQLVNSEVLKLLET